MILHSGCRRAGGVLMQGTALCLVGQRGWVGVDEGIGKIEEEELRMMRVRRQR